MAFFKKRTENKLPHNYVVGQEWHYATRSHEPSSTLKILKIEQTDEGKLIHISLSGLNMKHPGYPGGVLREALHIPVGELALQKSTTAIKEDRTSLPDYEFGYVRWKTAFDQEKAGYFNIPVNEIIDYLEAKATK